MLSNLPTYLAIAEDALSEAKRLDAKSRTPKANGIPGFVVAFDPDRKSFKQSLIALIFAGVYFEALLFVVGTQRLGRSEYLKVDKKKYEDKLVALGLTDVTLLASCKRFREARNDLVHEKAIEMEEIASANFRRAQKEAEAGLMFVKSVAHALHNAP